MVVGFSEYFREVDEHMGEVNVRIEVFGQICGQCEVSFSDESINATGIAL